MNTAVQTAAPVIALWTSWTTRFLRSTIFSKSTPHPVCLGFGTLLSLRTPTWPIGVGGAQCSNRLSYDQIFSTSLKCHRPSQVESVFARLEPWIVIKVSACPFSLALLQYPWVGAWLLPHFLQTSGSNGLDLLVSIVFYYLILVLDLFGGQRDKTKYKILRFWAKP